MTICVYALTGRLSIALPLRGLAGEPLRLITAGPLTAIVGQLRRRPSPSTAALTRYDRAVRALAERLPAVLPARFGTCFSNSEELEFVLRTRRRTLLRALAHVRRRAQMTLRIVESSGSGSDGMGESRLARSVQDTIVGPGSRYLRERAAVAARQRFVAGLDPVRTAVKRFVRDERVEKRGRIASVYHLVPRAAVEDYRQTVTRAASAGNLKLAISGPFPPYAFSEV